MRHGRSVSSPTRSTQFDERALARRCAGRATCARAVASTVETVRHARIHPSAPPSHTSVPSVFVRIWLPDRQQERRHHAFSARRGSAGSEPGAQPPGRLGRDVMGQCQPVHNQGIWTPTPSGSAPRRSRCDHSRPAPRPGDAVRHRRRPATWNRLGALRRSGRHLVLPEFDPAACRWNRCVACSATAQRHRE